tara:strand:- start:1123 stop:2994 length:1872 start_codon:yes stop_codon:yes gene_type:complete
MAKDAVSASILKSNLDLLKREGSELLSLFDDVNKKAASLGTNMSSSVRSIVGEINRLESSLSGLQSRLQRLTSTGSALGAANISSALGQLTGQGRGYGGGGAYGGGGGGGGLGIPGHGGMFNRGMGSAMGGLAAQAALHGAKGVQSLVGMIQPRGWKGALGKFIGGAAVTGTGQAAALAARTGGAAIDVSTGMGMAALQQSYATGLAAEQASRYAAGRSLIGSPNQFTYSWTDKKKKTRFGGLVGGQGHDPMAAHAMMQAYYGTGGAIYGAGHGTYSRHGGATSRDRWATKSGIDPMSMLPMISGARTLGVSGAGAWRGTKGSYGTLQEIIKRRGFSGAAASAESKAIAPFFLGGASSLMKMQGLGGAGDFTGSQKGIEGFVASLLTRMKSPQAAASVAQRMGGGTFSPGGGEAGQLFQMRAYGFGNPRLGQYQDQARKMGVDPNLFKRRGYFEYLRFKEGDMLSKIQASVVGTAVEGRGNKEFQAKMLSEQFNIPFTQAEQVIGLGASGGLSRSALEGITGIDPAGKRANAALSRAAAGLKEKGISVATTSGIKKVANAMAKLQGIQYDALNEGIKGVTDGFDKLGKVFEGNKWLITGGLEATITIIGTLLSKLPTPLKKNP